MYRSNFGNEIIHMRPLISLFIFLSITPIWAQIAIQGKVFDQETHTALSFASIGLTQHPIGTTSGEQGQFKLILPQGYADDTLMVSFMGYEVKKFLVSNISAPLKIGLEPTQIALQEVVIRPLSPTGYIKRAVRKIPVNYPSQPFKTQAYYREKLIENKTLLKQTEAVFHSYYPKYIDTVKNQHQLLLYKAVDQADELSFMKGRIQMERDKQKEKALAEGKKEEDLLDFGDIFGGPEVILKTDIVGNLDAFLDSTQFKKFHYEIEGATTHQGRNLMVIAFKAKRSVDNLKPNGKIYLDIETDAIAWVEYASKIVIPLVAKPLLFMFGFRIKKPTLKYILRYTFFDGYWYPEQIQWNANVQLKKKYLFKKNEQSRFKVEQLFLVNKRIEPAEAVPEGKQFNMKEKSERQVHNDISLTWEEVNRVR